MRFSSLKEMRDLLEEGKLLKSGLGVEKALEDDYIPVTDEELKWYKFQLDGLSLEQRVNARTHLNKPFFHGFELKVTL